MNANYLNNTATHRELITAGLAREFWNVKYELVDAEERRVPNLAAVADLRGWMRGRGAPTLRDVRRCRLR